jgi:hypothetical protein
MTGLLPIRTTSSYYREATLPHSMKDEAMPTLSARQQRQAIFLAACGFAVFGFGIRLGYQLVHRLVSGA